MLPGEGTVWGRELFSELGSVCRHHWWEEALLTQHGAKLSPPTSPLLVFLPPLDVTLLFSCWLWQIVLEHLFPLPVGSAERPAKMSRAAPLDAPSRGLAGSSGWRRGP